MISDAEPGVNPEYYWVWPKKTTSVLVALSSIAFEPGLTRASQGETGQQDSNPSEEKSSDFIQVVGRIQFLANCQVPLSSWLLTFPVFPSIFKPAVPHGFLIIQISLPPFIRDFRT